MCLHVVINLYPSQPINLRLILSVVSVHTNTHMYTHSGHAVSPAATSEPFTLTHIERGREKDGVKGGGGETGLRWKERDKETEVEHYEEE